MSDNVDGSSDTAVGPAPCAVLMFVVLLLLLLLLLLLVVFVFKS